jgi:hypothetical protein
VEQALQKVHSLFASKGFILNLQKGKTSVVATFKGVGAAALRKRYQLGTNPGITTRLGNAEAFVHFVPQYKHLGTVYILYTGKKRDMHRYAMTAIIDVLKDWSWQRASMGNQSHLQRMMPPLAPSSNFINVCL